MLKKTISIILTLAMVLSMTSMMATPAFAEETNECKLITDAGETEYENVKEAINAIPENGTGKIVLLGNVTKT